MREEQLAKVKKFMQLFETEILPEGTLRPSCPAHYVELNRRINVEEITETMEKGIRSADIIETADGLGDTLYTLCHAVNQLGRVPDRQLDAAALVLLSEARQRLELVLGDNGTLVDEDTMDRNLSFAEIVVRGVAATYEIPLEKIFDEINRSNMTKVWPDGKGRKDAGGKVMKPEGYTKPDIKKVLMANK